MVFCFGIRLVPFAVVIVVVFCFVFFLFFSLGFTFNTLHDLLKVIAI